MLVNRKVTIKVIVTEEFKAQLAGRLRQALQEVELSQQQLDQQGKGYLSTLSGKDAAQVAAFRRRLERQIRRQQEVKAGLARELAEAEGLALGSEYVQGTLDSLVDVHIGDNLAQKISEAAIVLKDGIVLEIRHD